MTHLTRSLPVTPSLVTRHDFSGGDDRIRTCEGLLTLNGLANRRLQPLGHISAAKSKVILSAEWAKSRRVSSLQAVDIFRTASHVASPPHIAERLCLSAQPFFE